MIGWGSPFPTNGRENAQKLRAKGRVLRGRPRVKHFYKTRLNFAEIVVVGITPRTPWEHQKSQKKSYEIFWKIFFWNSAMMKRNKSTNLDFEETTGNTATDSLPSRSWNFYFVTKRRSRKNRRKNQQKNCKKQLEKNQNEKMRLIFSCLLDPKTLPKLSPV